jgi:outer membrane receptor for ferrienterochelin and colicin
VLLRNSVRGIVNTSDESFKVSWSLWQALVLGLSLLVLYEPRFSVAADSDEEEANELSPVTVTSTRTPELVKDEPLHVEMVPSEEIEENLTEAPGDVTALFRELPGIHLQSSAPGLGGARM